MENIFSRICFYSGKMRNEKWFKHTLFHLQQYFQLGYFEAIRLLNYRTFLRYPVWSGLTICFHYKNVFTALLIGLMNYKFINKLLIELQLTFNDAILICKVNEKVYLICHGKIEMQNNSGSKVGSKTAHVWATKGSGGPWSMFHDPC